MRTADPSRLSKFYLGEVSRAYLYVQMLLPCIKRMIAGVVMHSDTRRYTADTPQIHSDACNYMCCYSVLWVWSLAESYIQIHACTTQIQRSVNMPQMHICTISVKINIGKNKGDWSMKHTTLYTIVQCAQRRVSDQFRSAGDCMTPVLSHHWLV